MDFTSYWKGTQAYLMLVLRKKEGKPIFTTQSEAERRAAICAECPKHISAEHVARSEKSWTEEWAKGKFRQQIQGRRTSKDEILGKCGVCECETRTIAHLHKDLMDLAGDKSEHPENCWKHNAR